MFLVYSNGVFSLYEYGFLDAGVYNSLSLLRHRRYRIEDPQIRTAAGRYLGLFRRPDGKKGVGHELSDIGRRLFSMTFRGRNLAFVRLILQHEVFHRVLWFVSIS